MAIISASEHSLVLKVGADPKALFVHYEKLDTGQPKGQIDSPARLGNLVAPQEEMAAVVADVVAWIAEVNVAEGYRPADLDILPDMDLELRITRAAGPPVVIDYLIEIGIHASGVELMIHITWGKSTDDVTIHAGPEFTISYEAFIYYVRTLEELIRLIELEKLV